MQQLLRYRGDVLQVFIHMTDNKLTQHNCQARIVFAINAGDAFCWKYKMLPRHVSKLFLYQ